MQKCEEINTLTAEGNLDYLEKGLEEIKQANDIKWTYQNTYQHYLKAIASFSMVINSEENKERKYEAHMLRSACFLALLTINKFCHKQNLTLEEGIARADDQLYGNAITDLQLAAIYNQSAISPFFLAALSCQVNMDISNNLVQLFALKECLPSEKENLYKLLSVNTRFAKPNSFSIFLKALELDEANSKAYFAMMAKCVQKNKSADIDIYNNDMELDEDIQYQTHFQCADVYFSLSKVPNFEHYQLKSFDQIWLLLELKDKVKKQTLQWDEKIEAIKLILNSICASEQGIQALNEKFAENKKKGMKKDHVILWCLFAANLKNSNCDDDKKQDFLKMALTAIQESLLLDNTFYFYWVKSMILQELSTDSSILINNYSKAIRMYHKNEHEPNFYGISEKDFSELFILIHYARFKLYASRESSTHEMAYDKAYILYLLSKSPDFRQQSEINQHLATFTNLPDYSEQVKKIDEFQEERKKISFNCSLNNPEKVRQYNWLTGLINEKFRELNLEKYIESMFVHSTSFSLMNTVCFFIKKNSLAYENKNLPTELVTMINDYSNTFDFSQDTEGFNQYNS